MACSLITGWCARRYNSLKEKLKAVGPLSKSLYLLELAAMVLFVVLVYVFRGQRINAPDIYYTSDPWKNMKNGVNYTCGCSLPGPLQTAQILRDESQSKWDTCYDSSSLETVNILMYPNFTGVNFLENILYDVYPNTFNVSREQKVVPGGVNATVHAHDLAWGGNFGAFWNYSAKVPELYPDGNRQPFSYINVNDLAQGSAFWDFPAAYLSLTFTYTCDNCSSCNLSTVNQIFTRMSGKSDNNKGPWGQCVYWGKANACDISLTYEAKCVMYPQITPVPLVFVIKQFFVEFFMLKGIANIYPPFLVESPEWINFTSMSPNELHMILGRDLPTMVELNFLEIKKSSSARLLLLDRFPTLDTECSKLRPVMTYNGSSVCNVYKDAESQRFEVKCLAMTNETYCRALHSKVTIDDVPLSIWNLHNVTAGNWLDLMCPPYPSESVPKPPYLVLSQVTPAMDGDSLNKFLQSNYLLDYWAAESGVCTKTYADIIRYLPEKGRNATAHFMEANCSGSSQSGYCWLSGRYRKLTDSPHDPWHQMNGSSRSEDTFVCYNIGKQGHVTWLIFLFGIIFGWLGPIHAVFKCVHLCFVPSKRGEQMHPAEPSAAPATDAETPSREEKQSLGGISNTFPGRELDRLPARSTVVGDSSIDDAMDNSIPSPETESAVRTPPRFPRAFSFRSYSRLETLSPGSG